MALQIAKARMQYGCYGFLLSQEALGPRVQPALTFLPCRGCICIVLFRDSSQILNDDVRKKQQLLG